MNIDIHELIPQREPIIMIDTFHNMEEYISYTGLKVTPDNLFCRQEKLDECGITEHIAQSAAARIGYICHTQQIPVPIGYIGSVDKMKYHRLPAVGEELYTRIEVLQEVFDITLIAATVMVNEEVIAEGQLKIFLKKEV